MTQDITAGWHRFAADCNKDSGYPNSHQAAMDRSALEEAWRHECPGLQVPQVLPTPDGRYEVSGFSTPIAGS